MENGKGRKGDRKTKDKGKRIKQNLRT